MSLHNDSSISKTLLGKLDNLFIRKPIIDDVDSFDMLIPESTIQAMVCEIPSMIWSLIKNLYGPVKYTYSLLKQAIFARVQETYTCHYNHLKT